MIVSFFFFWFKRLRAGCCVFCFRPLSDANRFRSDQVLPDWTLASEVFVVQMLSSIRFLSFHLGKQKWVAILELKQNLSPAMDEFSNDWSALGEFALIVVCVLTLRPRAENERTSPLVTVLMHIFF